ncbi:MAG: penicillin-binding protein 2 [Ignavibacteria bacterium]|nr:penicillin-binding protein 2 [Ignavibacteria bacterium]OIO16526.1 MAG: penicillin-binding protein 2 [Ignavibacteria bacterium CG1_02_37_35]PIS45872.1 MAG: penicillin-binding protein 2 [Ignavibacteria bacterium CG08_land_8_20_14_0_20_37_9]PIX94748.1 MAG: penicillin-binding protein 2 [Ignavibacteria bacterium CG_4_10_14_3_um_filter_37_18]PJC60931.1 MAG: penicillin-binding protein 2 [Ignavibacteria bacterium CG_4_9_14_0_2_um_filter_37_13]
MSARFSPFDRKKIFYGIILAVVSVYIFKLFQMQILAHAQFDAKSSDNSIKAIEQIALRGVFYDRNLQLLVENTPAYTVRITPADYDTTLNRKIETVLDLESGFISNMLYKNRVYSKFIPLRAKRGSDFSAIAWIEENKEHLPGVDYVIEMQRGYPDSVMGAHVFGYSKEISPQQLKKEEQYYQPGDLIGSIGLEKKYEKDLRGEKGYDYILVDSRRREVGKYKNGLNDVPSQKGKDLVLSLDGELQRIAEVELNGRAGAVVAIEPATGEVMVLASSPQFDLNQFSYVTPRDYLRQLLNDPLKPQYNRATMSAHPPGSTFKLLCAIAALDLGVITPSTTLFCGGSFNYGRSFKCHGSHGSLNVIQAIEKSCNVFFYQLIFKIGLDNLKSYATRFGFGKKLGIDINEEMRGLIPNSAYYEKIYGKNWPQGILVSLGIGQGEINVTPLQLANYCALIANNGKSFVPHLVKGYLDENKKFHSYKYKQVNVGIKQSVFDVVKEGMFLVVNGAGTATHVRINDIQIAGKTGTAQNPHGKDHALFVAFAPYGNPKIAVAVLVENVGFGATWAAPIAKKIIETYVRRSMPKKTEHVEKNKIEVQQGAEIFAD